MQPTLEIGRCSDNCCSALRDPRKRCHNRERSLQGFPFLSPSAKGRTGNTQLSCRAKGAAAPQAPHKAAHCRNHFLEMTRQTQNGRTPHWGGKWGFVAGNSVLLEPYTGICSNMFIIMLLVTHKPQRTPLVTYILVQYPHRGTISWIKDTTL